MTAAAAAAPVAIGEVVGAYRIVSMLGAGGMGAVWLAEHTLLGRRVAIKFLHAEISQSPAIVERFFAEARAATRIADPAIVVVFDFGWHTDHRAYIVMEHLAGESVATRLRAGRFAVADAVRVVQQVAAAMAVAHRSGIIHRDLKPDNVFLVADPAGERVKILDFGIAKLVGDDQGNPTRTRTGTIMGTPTYMSPEQCRGAGDVDHRTDVYALGCVLFHLLTGEVPFSASTPGDMIAAHLREPPPTPSALVSAVPAAIDAIVIRCMAKAADDRYATMTDLVHALGEAMAVRVVEAPSVRAPRRGRALALVLGAVALAVVAALLARASRSASPAPDDARPAPADAAVDSSTGDAAPAIVVPLGLDAGVPVDAAPKATPRLRARPTAPRCDDDPYACP